MQTGSTIEEVRSHYDSLNSFYQLWLDESMSYSCAMFKDGDALEEAQRRKVKFHLDSIEAKTCRSILDIGCGWGGGLRSAVRDYGVADAVGITVTRDQAAYINNAKSPGVSAIVADWKDFNPERRFDGIVSVGAFEHFGRVGVPSSQRLRGYRYFFQRAWEWLGTGRYLSLQTIAYGNMNREQQSDFINTDIFPGSELPTLEEIALSARGLFEIESTRNDRRDYQKTCEIWLSRLRANKSRAIELVGPEKVENYTRFLRMSILGFYAGNLELLRLRMRRNDHPRFRLPIEDVIS